MTKAVLSIFLSKDLSKQCDKGTAMADGVQIAARVEKYQAEALQQLADANGVSVSEVIRQLIPTGFMLKAILEKQRLEKSDFRGGTLGEVLGRMWSSALERDMHESHPFVSKRDTMSRNPESMAEHFLHFLEALSHKSGLINDPDWRFETPPKGGKWEEQGEEGVFILPRGVRLTPDGREILIGDEPE
ncbi:MAG: ribbon-helix-helix protein, CopG family [Phycisphaerales bacterium]|nr:ribbon-helix-helix protein, CopG family [Phycisphaerales bacterium]